MDQRKAIWSKLHLIHVPHKKNMIRIKNCWIFFYLDQKTGSCFCSGSKNTWFFYPGKKSAFFWFHFWPGSYFVSVFYPHLTKAVWFVNQDKKTSFCFLIRYYYLDLKIRILFQILRKVNYFFDPKHKSYEPRSKTKFLIQTIFFWSCDPKRILCTRYFF